MFKLFFMLKKLVFTMRFLSLFLMLFLLIGCFSNKGEESVFKINSLQLCEDVDDYLNCKEKKDFKNGDKVFLLFEVENSVVNNEISLVANYKLFTGYNNLILDSEKIEPYEIKMKSEKKVEKISAADSFVISEGEMGTYFLELTINDLNSKKVIFQKVNFELTK